MSDAEKFNKMAQEIQKRIIDEMVATVEATATNTEEALKMFAAYNYAFIHTMVTSTINLCSNISYGNHESMMHIQRTNIEQYTNILQDAWDAQFNGVKDNGMTPEMRTIKTENKNQGEK